MINGIRHGCRYLDFHCGGNRFLTLENNIFKITFWLNKGADLVEIRHKALDIDVLWRTPMHMPDAGLFIPPHQSPVGSFFDYYPGGWQEVFPNAHLPVSDYKNAPLGLHGEVCLLPWTFEIIEHHEELLRIRFAVETTRTPFTLSKVITIRQNEPFFHMAETIHNQGNEDMHYNWGHHPVFGAPFVEGGCVIDVPDDSITVIPEESFTSNERYARNQRKPWPLLKANAGGYVDASMIMSPDAKTADSFYVEPSSPWAALRNPRINLGIGMAWELPTFPYLWIWQAYCGSQGYPFYSRNYNVAIEPYSVPIETLSESISRGHSHQIKAGEEVHTGFLFGFTQGTQPIKHIGLEGTFTY